MKVEQRFVALLGDYTIVLQTHKEGHSHLAPVSQQAIIERMAECIEALDLQLRRLGDDNPRGYRE